MDQAELHVAPWEMASRGIGGLVPSALRHVADHPLPRFRTIGLPRTPINQPQNLGAAEPGVSGSERTGSAVMPSVSSNFCHLGEGVTVLWEVLRDGGSGVAGCVRADISPMA